MASKTDPDDWSARLTAGIAARVRARRKELGLTVEQVASASEGFGAPIPRRALNNLESGRRSYLTVSELLALSRALSLPPTALLAPLDSVETLELLPGEELTGWAAFEWLVGARYVGDQIHWAQWQSARERELLGLWLDYRLAERDLAQALYYASTQPRTIEDRQQANDIVRARREALAVVRSELAALGVTEVADDFEHLDSDASS